jgi:hypothetical protein
MSAYVRLNSLVEQLHTSAYVSIELVVTAAAAQDTSGYVRIRQHTSGYVSIRQHTSNVKIELVVTAAAVAVQPSAFADVC